MYTNGQILGLLADMMEVDLVLEHEELFLGIIAIFALCAIVIRFVAVSRNSRLASEDPLPERSWAIVGAHSFSHMVVDMASIYCVLVTTYSYLSGGLVLAVLYNAIAFGLQYFFGVLADRRTAKFSRLGTVCAFALIIVSILLLPFVRYDTYFGLLPVTLVGLGNACFHSFAGKEVLDRHENDPMAAGAFVCTGALGLAIGGILAALDVHMIVVCLLLLVCALGEIFVGNIHETSPDTISLDKSDKFVCLLLAGTVMLRSLVGLRTPSVDINLIPMLSVGVIAVVLGKCVGGVVADKIGVLKTTIGSLALATLCFAFVSVSEVMLLPATFFFNFTMPITLCMMSDIMRGRAGAAFGLLSGALLVGYLLSLMLSSLSLPNYFDLAIFSSLSLALMLWVFILHDEPVFGSSVR